MRSIPSLIAGKSIISDFYPPLHYTWSPFYSTPYQTFLSCCHDPLKIKQPNFSFGAQKPRSSTFLQIVGSKNVHENHRNHRFIWRQTSQTLPQCLLHTLRNGLQPVPPTSSLQVQESTGSFLSLRLNLHGRQLCPEGVFSAQGQRKGNRRCISRHESEYVIEPLRARLQYIQKPL